MALQPSQEYSDAVDQFDSLILNTDKVREIQLRVLDEVVEFYSENTNRRAVREIHAGIICSYFIDDNDSLPICKCGVGHFMTDHTARVVRDWGNYFNLISRICNGHENSEGIRELTNQDPFRIFGDPEINSIFPFLNFWISIQNFHDNNLFWGMAEYGSGITNNGKIELGKLRRLINTGIINKRDKKADTVDRIVKFRALKNAEYDMSVIWTEK